MTFGLAWVIAVVLAAVAMPSLLSRLAGGHAPTPAPELAALAPLAMLPAIVAVIVAATVTWWLTVVLAIPAATLIAWQLPPRRRNSSRIMAKVSQASQDEPDLLILRVLTLNAQGGLADPAALVGILCDFKIDLLAVQELTPVMVSRLSDVGLTGLLPFSHLDPRPGSPGVGLWARWPLAPVAAVSGLEAAAPRARVEPIGKWPVTFTVVHPLAPVSGQANRWECELRLIKSALADVEGPQVVAGDFNATRDHRPFRDLLGAGFIDCADAAIDRSWPGFTWPVARRIPCLVRLDHVLVSQESATVRTTRVIRVPGTDHCSVLAVVELRRVAHQMSTRQQASR